MATERSSGDRKNAMTGLVTFLSSGFPRERKVTIWDDTHAIRPQVALPPFPSPATTSKPAFRGIASSSLQRGRAGCVFGAVHTLATHHSVSLHP